MVSAIEGPDQLTEEQADAGLPARSLSQGRGTGGSRLPHFFPADDGVRLKPNRTLPGLRRGCAPSSVIDAFRDWPGKERYIML